MNQAGLTVALINPPHVARLNRDFESGVPPLGLGSIAAHLRANGVCCDVFDLADEWPLDPDALHRMNLFEYDVFGLTSYSKNFFAAEALLRIIRKQRPGAAIVLGGPHAGAIPEQVLRSLLEIDFVVRNDGEAAMLSLVQELGSVSPCFDRVPNLIYRQNGEVAVSSVKDPVDVDLDHYAWPLREARAEPAPVPFHIRRDGQVVRKEFFSSSRGCPKRCTFCSIIVMSPQYRYRSAYSLMQEISELHRSKPFGHVVFLDANFFVNWRRAREFAERLYEFDPTITWSGTATTDQICRHWETIIEIGSLNCSSMEVGIENGSNSVLRRFNKRTTVDQNLACVKILRAAGIRLELDYILFDPFVSMEELAENVIFLKQADLSDYVPADHLYSAVKLYPGTTARAKYLEKRDLAEDDFGIPPFESTQVQALFDAQIWFARTHLRTIEQTIERLDKTLDRALSGAPGYEDLDTLLTSELLVAIRGLPFTFFDELVKRSLTQGARTAIDDILPRVMNDLRITELLVKARGDLRLSSGYFPKSLEHGRARILQASSGFYLLSDVARPLALSEAGLDAVRRVLDGNVEREQQPSGVDELTLPRVEIHRLFADLGIRFDVACT